MTDMSVPKHGMNPQLPCPWVAELQALLLQTKGSHGSLHQQPITGPVYGSWSRLSAQIRQLEAPAQGQPWQVSQARNATTLPHTGQMPAGHAESSCVTPLTRLGACQKIATGRPSGVAKMDSAFLDTAIGLQPQI